MCSVYVWCERRVCLCMCVWAVVHACVGVCVCVWRGCARREYVCLCVVRTPCMCVWCARRVCGVCEGGGGCVCLVYTPCLYVCVCVCRGGVYACVCVCVPYLCVGGVCLICVWGVCACRVVYVGRGRGCAGRVVWCVMCDVCKPCVCVYLCVVCVFVCGGGVHAVFVCGVCGEGVCRLVWCVQAM